MLTLTEDITYSEFNRLHYDLGGVLPVIQGGRLDTVQLGSFIYNVEQLIRPKERVEIPGQLSLFDAEEYATGG